MAKHTDEFDDQVTPDTNSTPNASDALQQARSTASDLANAVPGAASSAGDAARQVQAQMGSMSFEGLAVGSALSLGTALGLLISGSNRLLVLLALIPAIVMGSYLVNERQSQQPRMRLH
ncbi:MAG: hypothetical protein M0Z49_02045 [Chloroflexi bacterium]|nr:hypothetical protein [Chloroflexota bacterium]